MLDRTKLKRIGKKNERWVMDDEYAELLIGKMILLGAKWQVTGNTKRLMVPLYEPYEWETNVGVYGTSRRPVMHRRGDDKHWTVHTKRTHQFLYYHLRGKHE